MTGTIVNHHNMGERYLYFIITAMTITMVMVSPFLSIFVLSCMTILLLNKRSTQEKYMMCLVLCIACAGYVSLVNILRVPENDLERYIEGYQDASKFSLIEFMKVGSSRLEYATDTQKEPLYGLLVWIFNRMYEGNVKLFVFSVSFLQYLFFCYSLILMGRHLPKLYWWSVATCIVLMCFIPYIFTLSIHLIRQCLANSILFVLIVRRCFMEKKDYLLWFTIPFIHSSAWFFVPLFFVDSLKKSLSHNKLFILGFVLFFVAIRIISGGITAEISGTAGYVAERMLNDTDDGESSILLVLLNAFIFISLVYVAYFSRLASLNGVKHFCHIWMALLVFLLINYDNPFFVMRFSFYLYPLVAVIALLLLVSFKFHNLIGISLTVLSMMAFIWYLYNGPWTFNMIDSPISMSIFDYIN